MTGRLPRLPVLVFAKPPRAGEAKTRLAEGIGPQAAAALARAFFQDTWAAVSSRTWAGPLLATTDPEAPEWRELRVRRAWPQGDGDLGDRLERTLGRALEAAPAALVVGTDSPGLPGDLLDDARRALETADAVLGPSDDGGFYLLGLRRMADGLLQGLPWSSAETFERTKERLLERGLSVHVLPRFFDVDLPGDLEPLRPPGRQVDPQHSRRLKRHRR